MHCKLYFLLSIGITGYSTILPFYYRGDVAVGYLAAATPGDDLSGNGVVFPESDIDLHEQADLGEGISFSSPGSNHAVAIIGWGPCRVTHVSLLRVKS